MGRAFRYQSKTPPEADLMADPEVAPETLREGVVWKDVFGRAAPVEIEIGFGKGRFLIHRATEQQDINLLGIECALAFARLARYRIWRRLLPNVKVLHADALTVMAQLVPADSVRAVHVLFPDPWPKKRHHKRRLVTPEFVTVVTRTLEPGGLINLATDHADYAEAIEASLATCEGLARLEKFRLGGDLAQLTNYGTKYAREGRSFRTWSLQKIVA